jgi:hypothetical protein
MQGSRPGTSAAAAPLSATPQPASGISSYTPRGYSRGPRSYALALAGSFRSAVPQHSQIDNGMHNGMPVPATARPGARPGTAGYHGQLRMQLSSSGRINSSRGPVSGAPSQAAGQQQQQHSHLQQMRQPPSAAAGPAGVLVKSSSGGTKQDPFGSFRRPGSAAAVGQGTACQVVAVRQAAGFRPHTVAAGTPLLLAECFRPSTAAAPASISGMEGHQCVSRPQTAAAAVVRWWDAASAGLSCEFSNCSELVQDGDQEAQQQWQQQQQWCAVHEIDGRPVTRNGMRSRSVASLQDKMLTTAGCSGVSHAPDTYMYLQAMHLCKQAPIH